MWLSYRMAVNSRSRLSLADHLLVAGFLFAGLFVVGLLLAGLPSIVGDTNR